jgi:hypothetical protein
VVRIDLKSSDLFGNEAAEDEVEAVFSSTLLRRDDLAEFDDARNSIKVISAYKGEGKSSLLRALASQLSEKEDCFVITTTGPAAAPDVSSPDTAKWAKAWKKSLFSLIAARVGAAIGMAWSDDSISLVEEAEKHGFRRKSLIGTITDRLRPEVSLAGGSMTVALQSGTPERSHEEILKRFSNDKIRFIWIIVDDIDRNYRDTKLDKAKIVGFFDAIRDMHNAIPQLRVRTSIRPNVYASVRLEHESFSHIRQYILKMSWSESQIRQMLARRVEGYLSRSGQLSRADLASSGSGRDNDLISLAFESPARWGGGEKKRLIHIPLYTLSVHRPRWVIELCKLAASRHHAVGAKISIDDITAEMADFGESRKADVSAEFKIQCPQLDEMIDAFYEQKSIMTTEELFKIIEERILSSFIPNIAGMSDRPRSGDVASFLFEVGLFFGRRDLPDGSYEHISFAERPSLLRSRSNPDDGLRWEIHPVFRQALRIGSAETWFDQ